MFGNKNLQMNVTNAIEHQISQHMFIPYYARMYVVSRQTIHVLQCAK